jgi:hypothetical protein
MARILISRGALSSRVVEGSTIRIGVSEIGYAFAAPTGIVDHDLRHAGGRAPSAWGMNYSPGFYQVRRVLTLLIWQRISVEGSASCSALANN